MKNKELSEETTFTDNFGNKVTDTKYGGDQVVRVAQTNRTRNFYLLKKVYSMDILRQNTILKTYYWEYHHSAQLMRDIYGRLQVHFYDEEMRFDGDDRVDYLWVFVSGEADADEIVKAGKLLRLREPYIAGSETDWMSAHEIIPIQRSRLKG